MSWRPILTGFRICGWLFLVALLVRAAFSETNEDPRELLSKSFQQADLWSHGPVKLVAKVHVDNPDGQAQNLQYVVYWDGPEKWRAEWSAPGRRKITIVNNGKLSYASNQPKALWSTIWFEAALAALDGGSPAGPYLSAPFDYENAKLHASKKRLNGADARCVAFGKPEATLCIAPASGHLLTADGNLGSFEYSDYTSVGSSSYPQTVKISYVTTSVKGDDYIAANGGFYPQNLEIIPVKTPVADAHLTVTRGEQFSDSLFVPPASSTTVSFASCADSATNFSPPHLEKSVKAKRPEGYTYGIVWVLAAVGKDGSVQGTEVLGGPYELRTGATSAVRRYKYTPYIRCGHAVEFQQVVGIDFAAPPPTIYTPH